MKRHAQMHSARGADVFWCRVCEPNKSFTRADNRDKHLKYHSK